MARQEREREEEKMKKNRQGSVHSHATTDSLTQSDFLKDLVDRKEQEENSSGSLLPLQSPVKTPIVTKRVGGIFSRLPFRNNNRNNPKVASSTDEVEETSLSPTTSNGTSSIAADAVRSSSSTINKENDIDIKNDKNDNNGVVRTDPLLVDESSGEMINGVTEGDRDDEKVLNLMT